MINKGYYDSIVKFTSEEKKTLAILIDPDKFDVSTVGSFLKSLPKETTHLFIGGSTVEAEATSNLVEAIKKYSNLPIFLFPGDVSQITPEADALLFLTLLSGRNPEYLIGQQLKAIPSLKESNLEVISTAYILIDGGRQSAVERVSGTQPISQENIEMIVDTAVAGQYIGAKMIYLEAGSGANKRVNSEIISAVKERINIPLIVGGGIRNEEEKQAVYLAGADMVVMGTVFEK